jgi:hypothetical protein
VVRYNKNYVLGLKDRMKGPSVRLLANCQDYRIKESYLAGEKRYYYYASAVPLKTKYDHKDLKIFPVLAISTNTDNDHKDLKIFPVLAISTNTDNDRNLRADSFIVLRFDKDWRDPISGYLLEPSKMKSIDDLTEGM